MNHDLKAPMPHSSTWPPKLVPVFDDLATRLEAARDILKDLQAAQAIIQDTLGAAAHAKDAAGAVFAADPTRGENATRTEETLLYQVVARLDAATATPLGQARAVVRILTAELDSVHIEILDAQFHNRADMPMTRERIHQALAVADGAVESEVFNYEQILLLALRGLATPDAPDDAEA